MRLKVAPEAAIALVGAGATFVLGRAGMLPWPLLAARSLSVLFLLAAVTRIGSDHGLIAQKRLRWAVGGVALTAGIWFAGATVLLRSREFALLSCLHLVAAWLTAAPEEDRGERVRGWLILASTGTTVSLLALGLLPVATHVPGAPELPLVLAAVTLVGCTQIAQGRMIGLLLAAGAGAITLVLATDVWLDVLAYGGAFRSTLGRSAPLLAGTAILGALGPLARLAVGLPAFWRQLVPRGSPALHAALSWLTIPAVVFTTAALL
jgi:hypothetical protein